MYAVTGVTGQVGQVVARSLLAAGQDVRAIVRSAEKAQEWAQAGCDIAIADLQDASALARALQGADGFFAMLPPNFDPAPGFPQARALIQSLATAIDTARPGKVVCLSTVGAQATQPNLLQSLGLLEQALGESAVPVTFLRAAWFIENFVWDVATARDDGVLNSFLQPSDRPIPMVATADVGRVAAELLQTTWQGRQVVALEGPARVSPQDVADAFARLLGRPVGVRDVPAAQWHDRFVAQGMKHPLPRMQMLDGFNQGWLTFDTPSRQGAVGLDTVLRQLIERTA